MGETCGGCASRWRIGCHGSVDVHTVFLSLSAPGMTRYHFRFSLSDIVRGDPGAADALIEAVTDIAAADPFKAQRNSVLLL
jgi:hypothetical protein